MKITFYDQIKGMVPIIILWIGIAYISIWTLLAMFEVGITSCGIVTDWEDVGVIFITMVIPFLCGLFGRTK